MKILKLLARWNITGKVVGTIRILAIALLIAGALNFGRGAPAAHATALIVVSRTDDPTPIPSACSGPIYDCSLRGAIIYANAHSGSEIELDHGAVYTLSILGINKDATKGNLNITADMSIDYGNVVCNFNCRAIIQGGPGWDDNIFQIDSGVDITFSGFTIQNGNSSVTGGGIYNAGNLTLSSVWVRNNTAGLDGGGIYNYEGALTITGSSILANTSVGTGTGGGGLFNYTGTVTISDSSITNNTAVQAGGGIRAGYGAAGLLTLINTSVTNNTLTNGSGGGINASGTLNITGGEISDNTTNGANSGGGGLNFAGGGTATISGTEITGNHNIQYGASGGGISATSGSVQLTNVTLDNNNSGGIYFAGSTLDISGGTINNNTGTGISLTMGGHLTMSHTTVSGNVTGGYGGGIYLDTASSSISSSIISNNSSTSLSGQGGGIYFSGALSLVNSTVSGNSLLLTTGSTTLGGGILIDTNSTLTLTASTLDGNSAYAGGGIYSNGTVNATNSTLSGNTTVNGGGMTVYLGAATLSNVTITANHAEQISGVAVLPAATFTLKNSLIAGNISTTAGMGDCMGTLISQGHNLLGNGGCLGLTNGVNGDLVGSYTVPLNPRIGALANNGGLTRTHALLQGSPAIDAGDPNPANCLGTDQRGTARPIYSQCDIGAYEYGGSVNPLPQITGLSTNTFYKSCSSNGISLSVTGSNFSFTSVVRWNGSDRPTTYVNSGQLTAKIGSDDNYQDTCSLGTNHITVFSPAPGGGGSNSITVTVVAAPANYPIYLPAVLR